jgi:hypothetical protein
MRILFVGHAVQSVVELVCDAKETFGTTDVSGAVVGILTDETESLVALLAANPDETLSRP